MRNLLFFARFACERITLLVLPVRPILTALEHTPDLLVERASFAWSRSDENRGAFEELLNSLLGVVDERAASSKLRLTTTSWFFPAVPSSLFKEADSHCADLLV